MYQTWLAYFYNTYTVSIYIPIFDWQTESRVGSPGNSNLILTEENLEQKSNIGFDKVEEQKEKFGNECLIGYWHDQGQIMRFGTDSTLTSAARQNL